MRAARGSAPAGPAGPSAGDSPDSSPAPPVGDQPGAVAARQTLTRDERVRRSRDYLRAYRRGRRRSGALVTLHFVPNRDTEPTTRTKVLAAERARGPQRDSARLPSPRLGVTVSRKVGNSVVRHRVKRRIVEIFRRYPGRRELAGWDLVVHVHPRAATAPFAALRDEIESLLGALPGALPGAPPGPSAGGTRR